MLCLPLTACQKQQNLYSATWFDLFDTVAIVQGYAAGQDEWNTQAAAVQEDLSHYNELFDIYNHYDDVVNLYDVNAGAAAAPVAVDDELYAFLRWCKDTVYPATDGATNIAAGAVLRLWHDARESDSPAPPEAEAIAAALEHIDIENLVLDDDAKTVYFADPAMTLDVGAVGKGYAVEQTAQAAQARGLTSALLNIGGNVRAIGTKPGGKLWTAGVENDEILAHAVGIKMSVLIELHVGDLPLVKAIGSHQLDIGLACGIQCLAQALGATGQIAGIDTGTLDAAVGVIGVLLDQVVVQLDEVGQTALHDVVGIQQQADGIRVGIRKGLEGIKLRREELDEAVCHGANRLDLRAILHLSQAVGSADAAAQNSGIRTIIACALALCAAGAKLHDTARRLGLLSRSGVQ